MFLYTNNKIRKIIFFKNPSYNFMKKIPSNKFNQVGERFVFGKL